MISIESAAASIAAMEALIPFFPRDTNAQDYILAALRKMIATEEQLRWLTETAINSIQKWEGLPQLRGLFCSHFRPADGIEMECSVPGFTPADCERAYFERQASESARMLSDWHRQWLLSGAIADPELVPERAVALIKRVPAIEIAKGDRQ